MNFDKDAKTIQWKKDSLSFWGNWKSTGKERVQISFLMCAQSLSHVRLFVTFWIRACLAPLSVEFFRQILEWVAISSCRRSSKDQTRVFCISALQADSLLFSHWGRPPSFILTPKLTQNGYRPKCKS